MASLVARGQAWAPTDCACCASAREEGLTSFEKRKKDAASQALVVRAVWVALHVAVIAGLFAADTELTLAWRRRRVAYVAGYLLLAAANVALYVRLCCSNPGWLQPGVHALSLATIKRDSQASLPAAEAAELGIGGLAHIDAPLIGRQRGQRGQAVGGRPGLHLDRTTTLPDLSSQSSRKALLAALGEWDAADPGLPGGAAGSPSAPTAVREAAGAALHEARTESAAGILTLAERGLAAGGRGAGPGAAGALQGAKQRARGHSAGSEAEMVSVFRGCHPGDWDREAEEGAALLGGEAERDGGAAAASSSASRTHSSGAAAVASEERPDKPLARKPSKPLSPGAQPPRRRSSQWWEGPNPGRWCEYCGAWQLLRGRHCHACGRCVRRFDHHCAWLGRCIGEDNHATFWWYLAVQLALLAWSSRLAVGGLRGPPRPPAGRLLGLLLCALPTLPLTAFVAVLLGYHTYLVLTAQTSFEAVAGSEGGGGRVAYLRHLPPSVHPFSQGPAQNVLSFCCDTAAASYQMPARLAASRPDPF